jgi:hypothetical protein
MLATTQHEPVSPAERWALWPDPQGVPDLTSNGRQAIVARARAAKPGRPDAERDLARWENEGGAVR